eukprot:GHUV01040082.1.p1 GENE.GHUV01040082.1~~GHUV01040082.1.p1  ORF type:complete len:107 (+),score=11.32 GHUV01040082.1:469-789(+)
MTSDHGTLGLDWWCGADRPSYAAADVPIILFIHGINGRQTSPVFPRLSIPTSQRQTCALLRTRKQWRMQDVANFYMPALRKSRAARTHRLLLALFHPLQVVATRAM